MNDSDAFVDLIMKYVHEHSIVKPKSIGYCSDCSMCVCCIKASA